MPTNNDDNRDIPESSVEEKAAEEQAGEAEQSREDALRQEGEAENAAGPEMGGMPPLPAPTFSTFILSLASSALVHLGEVPDPSTGKQEENLPIAKHTIDILSMLEDKIANGLDQDEKRLLDGILYELRMKFVVKKQ